MVTMLMSVVALAVKVVGMMMMSLCTCLHFGGVLEQAADIGEDSKGNDGEKPNR